MLDHFCINPASFAYSDAKEVIYHRFGLDAGAAQLLKQTLQFNKSCSGGAHALATQDTAQPTGKSPSTFLAALLGPEVEAVALREARSKRLVIGLGICTARVQYVG